MKGFGYSSKDLISNVVSRFKLIVDPLPSPLFLTATLVYTHVASALTVTMEYHTYGLGSCILLPDHTTVSGCPNYCQ